MFGVFKILSPSSPELFDIKLKQKELHDGRRCIFTARQKHYVGLKSDFIEECIFKVFRALGNFALRLVTISRFKGLF